MTDFVLLLLAIVVASNTAVLVLVHRQLSGVQAFVYVGERPPPWDAATREHMRRWQAGEYTHEGESDDE